MSRLFRIVSLVVLLLLGGMAACERSDSARAESTAPSRETASTADDRESPGGAAPEAEERAAGADDGAHDGCGCAHAECQCSEQGYRYSAFGVELNGSQHFDLVSFKDVGLDSAPYTSRPILEIIAQSLAYEMNAHEGLDVSARLVHDDSLADPSQHTYCEANRLYVDVWHSSAPHRWGYSLWSGCSTAFNFAHREVPLEAPDRALEESVRPLTRGIAESLVEANHQNCYKRTC